MSVARRVEIAALGGVGRLMGLDIGRRRVGVAVSDSGLGVAVGLCVLERGKIADLARDLDALADEHGAGGYVVGLPLELGGGSGAAVRSVRGTMLGLSRAGLRRSWAEWDERLSSVAVARSGGAGVWPLRSERRGMDLGAAVWILQGALDNLRELSSD